MNERLRRLREEQDRLSSDAEQWVKQARDLAEPAATRGGDSTLTNSQNGRIEWEYRIFAQHTGEVPRLNAATPAGDMRGGLYDLMSGLGHQCWELVSTVQVDRDRVLLIFKRPVQVG